MFPELTRDDIFRLETQRLWLRWPRAADAEAMTRYAGDEEVALQTANIPHPYETKHADEHILAVRGLNASGEGLCLALTFKRQPNELIGLIKVLGADNRGVSELGYWLAKPFWRQGLMTEAAAAFVDLVLQVSSVDRIICSSSPANAASLRVQEKLGFVREGEDIREAPMRGGRIVVVISSLKRGAACVSFGAHRPRPKIAVN
jgi:RimJ/RimL family protein N-acetyltransferase